MRPGKQYPGGPELADAQDEASPADDLEIRARKEDPGNAWSRTPLVGCGAGAGGGLALFAFFLRISLGSRVDSDGANNALQAWDLLHGHIMLHGWVIGDATFYFLELPLIGIVELLLGMGNLAFHVASALTYLIVAVCAVALGVTDSRGPARAARGAVVVTVLAAPCSPVGPCRSCSSSPTTRNVRVHAGVLPADRPGAGQALHGAAAVRDLVCRADRRFTVRYIAVPAIIWSAVIVRSPRGRLRPADTAVAIAAAVSCRWRADPHGDAASRRYFMVAPRPISRRAQWPRHAAVTCRTSVYVRARSTVQTPGWAAWEPFRVGLPARRRVRLCPGQLDLAHRAPG